MLAVCKLVASYMNCVLLYIEFRDSGPSGSKKRIVIRCISDTCCRKSQSGVCFLLSSIGRTRLSCMYRGSRHFYKERHLAIREKTNLSSHRCEHLPLKIARINIIFLNPKFLSLAITKYFAMLSFTYVFLVLPFVHLATAKVWLGTLPSNKLRKSAADNNYSWRQYR